MVAVEDGAVLIAGGYGIVGAQIAELLRARHPDLPLLIAGRDGAAAEGLAARLGKARGVALDISDPDALDRLPSPPRAVLAAVNDTGDRLLLGAVRRGVDYVDITRWTERVRDAVVRLSAEKLTSAAVFSSGWMAGVAATVAAWIAQDYARVDVVDIDILYALHDRAGPNSFEYTDRLATPFQVVIDGEMRIVMPMTDPQAVTFASGFSGKTYRFDTPDQLTLPMLLRAGEVSARITYDDPSTVAFMRVLLRSGLWGLISGPAFTGLRRSIVFQPGKGDRHEVRVRVKGLRKDGGPDVTTRSIIDPLGQTHMTAAGAVAQVERLLGLGRERPQVGISFPEQAADLERGVASLRAMGVELTAGS